MLQPRRIPESVALRATNLVEQSRLQQGPPNGFRPGPPFGTNRFDPRLMRPSGPNQPQANRFGSPPREVPPAILKKYDRDKNGILDGAEWSVFTQELEKRREEKMRLRASTNSISAAVSTNKTEEAKPKDR